MTQRTPGIPENSSVVIPRLVCRHPASEIDFCVAVFGAVNLGARPGPNGEIAHALMRIGPAMIMIETEWSSLPSRAPSADGSSPVIIFVYVENVDETVDRAVARGARLLVAPQNQFWGDRVAWIIDPAAHVWTVATRIEETTRDQRSDRWSEIVDSKGVGK